MPTNTQNSKSSKMTKKKEEKTEDHNMSGAQENTTNKAKKSVRKAGRTLLVKSTNGTTINDSVFKGLEGLVNHVETKTTNWCKWKKS